jgi:hypothetical protein
MDEGRRAQIDTYLSHLAGLTRRGRELRYTLERDPPSKSAIAATRAWQQDCGVAVNQLSGGSKAHWLARSFSEAFLMRSTTGVVVESADLAEIVDRLLHVLEQGVESLSRMDSEMAISASPEAAPPRRRFDFVHNPQLRPFLEQAYTDSRRALEACQYGPALLTSCGILEAIVTDALEYRGVSALAAAGAPEGKIADWSFETRLRVAEKAGLLRSSCARLPQVARKYRDVKLADGDLSQNVEVSERDAKVTGQVLHVVMRDLDPGR